MELLRLVGLFLLPPLAYVLGSVSWGLMLTRAFTSVDIRNTGSGNIGATNVRRTAGTFLGILTLTGDVLKGAVPVWLGLRLSDPASLWGGLFIALVALAAFLGHLYPIYSWFRGGGKGVATAAGCFLAISPVAVLVAVLVFILLVCMTSRVSAGSLAGALILPLAVWKATGSGPLTACAGLMALWICIRHRDNISRLISGNESGI